MRGHERREERRDERQTFGACGNADRYQMREKMLSIGDDFWIEAGGTKVAEVSKKWFRIRDSSGVDQMSAG